MLAFLAFILATPSGRGRIAASERRIELAGQAFRVRLDLAGKAADREGIDWNVRFPLVNHLGEGVADAGLSWESAPAEPVCVQQVFVVWLQPITGSKSGR